MHDYAGSLPDTVAWLMEATGSWDWRKVFPRLAARWGRSAFDYAAEDRAVAAGHVSGMPLIAVDRERRN
ncbi:hypothetical protein ACWGHM_13720 [Streptomyces sp. NPDC054904]|uniref:hypothetical protein n=1 Tax=Streptomyces sp. Isolate_45 TaxID=2950111 RepID=UPI002481A737|nr:hypothetical protein [Streptomyces sp. Isolate_45]MDA5284311.1 hypothetical protein [Streptomyces sp. Isolate_45]